MHRFRMSCPQGAHKAHTRRPQGAHNCVFLPVCLHRFRELDFEFVRGETQLAAARRFHVHVLAQTLARTQTHAQTHVVCFTRTNARTHTNKRTCFVFVIATVDARNEPVRADVVPVEILFKPFNRTRLQQVSERCPTSGPRASVLARVRCVSTRFRSASRRAPA